MLFYGILNAGPVMVKPFSMLAGAAREKGPYHATRFARLYLI